MKTEVIIAERNEPDLKATVADIRANNPGVGVRVMSDKKGLGPQAMRHKGIMQSDADVVIIMDGHMRTLKNRLTAAADYIGNRGHKVACLKCFHSEEVDWSGIPYSGARLVWKSHGKDASEPQAFTAKWRTEDKTGKIGCVMGACYVFRRDWYIDGLKSPWQHGSGWGCDEELISAATWLRGGEVELLPWAVWHRARKAGTQPFRYSNAQLQGVWANRLRLLQVLPMPNEQRNDLVRHLMTATSKHNWKKIADISDRTAQWQAEYRSFLNAGGLSWAEFATQVMEKETVKVATMMELREQAREMGIKVPFGCRKADLAKMLADYDAGNKKAAIPQKEIKSSQKVDSAPKKPKQRANWGANEWNNLKKRECPHCGANNSVAVGVRHVGRLTLRQRKCKECAKFFPTREENPK